MYTPAPNYAGWWWTQKGVNNMPRLVMQPRPD